MRAAAKARDSVDNRIEMSRPDRAHRIQSRHCIRTRILSEKDTAIRDTDPSKSAIALATLAKRFDAAA